MTLSYAEIMGRERDILGQFNCFEDNNQDEGHQHEAYPYLFENEDSLFAPDAMFESNDAPGGKRTRVNSMVDGRLNCQKKCEEQEADDNQFFDAIKQIPKLAKNLSTKAKTNESSFILKKSSQLAINMQPSFERLTMPVRSANKKQPYKPSSKEIKKQYSRERIEKLSQPRALKTEPNQNVTYRKPDTQKKYLMPRSSNNMDVATRNQLWQEQKRLKIEKLRKQQQQNRLRKQSGTFAPKLTEYRGDKLANISNFGREGIANYFQRLNMAKSKTGTYSGKQNNCSYWKQNGSPYTSTKQSKTPKKQNEAKKNFQKIKYDEAVKQLHKKLMSLNI